MRIGRRFDEALGLLRLVGLVERIPQRTRVGAQAAAKVLFLVAEVCRCLAVGDTETPDGVARSIFGNDARVLGRLLQGAAQGSGKIAIVHAITPSESQGRRRELRPPLRGP